jgi:hypothetical protein
MRRLPFALTAGLLAAVLGLPGCGESDCDALRRRFDRALESRGEPGTEQHTAAVDEMIELNLRSEAAGCT